MLLRLRTGNRTSPYALIDTVSNDAYKDLKRWAYWIRSQIYIRNEPQCILGGMAEYGHWIRSAYVTETPPPDARIDQTKKVLVFMPEDLFMVIYMQYVMDCEKQFKYRRLGLTRPEYHVRLQDAVRFYDYYKDTEFA